MTKLELSEYISRRIRFLLQEARIGANRDQVITYAMRVVSNFATVNCDAQSSGVTKRSTRISQGALDRMGDCIKFSDWAKVVTNDHPQPIKLVWIWLCENSNNLTEMHVWDRFCEYPMVTILKTENTKLDKMGFRSKGDFKDRYHKAGIQIVQLPHTAFDEWIARQKSETF